LTSSRDFKRVFAAGKRGSSGLVTCVALDSGEQRAPRVGIAVGGSFGGAVRRNRIKRVIREAARAFSIRSGTDVVVIAKPPAAGRSLAEVRESIEVALGKAEALC